MEKYRNEKNEIGVVISVGYGAGWSTWASDENAVEALMFSRVLIERILSDEPVTAEWLKENMPEVSDNFFASSKYEDYENLIVQWVPKGEKFYIEEEGGYEAIVREHQMFTA